MNKRTEIYYGLTETSEILKSLREFKVENIVRVHGRTIFDDYMKDKDISINDFFDILPGAILVYLENGDVIGFDINEIKHSIVVWYDVHKGVEIDTEYHIRELSSYISQDDITYSHKDEWNHIVGHKMKKISVIDYDDGRYKRSFNDSFQRAIVLETDAGDMVLSYLPGRGEAFPLIRKSQIPKEIWDNSKIIEL